MAVSSLVIDGRFNGRADSGNGGYVCGVIANLIDGDAEVVLRHPAPLDKPLAIVYDDENVVRLLDGETLVAVGRPTQWSPAIPPLPTMAEAAVAATRYAGFNYHPVPTCFVCGNERN